MAKTEIIQSEIFEILAHVKKLETSKLYIDYDEDADVMYVSFQKPQNADDSEILENGTILRYSNNEVVGMTILNYNHRSNA